MNYYALLPLASAMVNVFLWTFVFALHHRTHARRVYLLFISMCAAWAFADFLAWSHQNPLVQYWLLRVSTLTWLSLTPLYLYFAYILLQRPVDWFLRFIGGSTVVFAAIALFTDNIAGGALQRPWGVVLIPGKLYFIAIFVCSAVPGVAAIHLIGRSVLGSSGLVRKQLLFFLSGVALTWALVLISNVLVGQIIGLVELPSMGSTFMLIQAIVVFVASTRYRFLSVGVQEAAMDIFSKASDGVLLLDCAGNLVEINEAARNLLGVSHAQVISSNVQELIPAPYDFAQNCENQEIEFGPADKPDAQVGLLSQCDFFQGRVRAGKLVTIRNITARKAAQKAVAMQQALEKKVQQNQEMKMLALGELASEIVHNVNNQMGGITGYTSLLRRKLKGNDTVPPLLDGIQRTVKNVVQMGDELLRFTKTDDTAMEKVDLHQAIHNCVSLASASFSEKIKLSLNLTAQNAWMMGSAADLENMLLNLCINAKDAMPNGGRIVIETENTSSLDSQLPANAQHVSSVTLTVRDTGKGIAPDVIDRVFEPFFTTRKKQGGTGLGLSNTFGIVKKLGGSIYVDSYPERGTAFVVRFPVV